MSAARTGCSPSCVLKVGALDFYPLTTALAEPCQELVVRHQPIVADLIGLPWLTHSRAVRDRVIDVGFTLTVDGRPPEASTMRSQPLREEPEAPPSPTSSTRYTTRSDLTAP
jgi:hypothetical protein